MTPEEQRLDMNERILKAVVGVDCFRSSAWLTYRCSECGSDLEKVDGRSVLLHPTFERKYGLFGQKIPLTCPLAGKKLKYVTLTVPLEEIP